MFLVQRYISRELTHFVGSKRLEEEQYLLLIEILRSGWLTHWPHIPPFESGDPSGLEIKTRGRISENEMYFPHMVCFCDIPLVDLPVHMSKYRSHFGISFLKSFLISQGANPVFYIAKNSIIRDSKRRYLSREKEFDGRMNVYQEVAQFIPDALSRREGKGRIPIDAVQKFIDVNVFLDFYVFSFLKLFDASLPDEDEKNYYMEREWRILGNLEFKLDDVYRIILPSSYARRLRKDLPEYMGQVTFAD